MGNNLVYLSLGTNIGNLVNNIQIAIKEIGKLGKISKKSSFYKTAPVDYKRQPDFLNLALALITKLSALELIEQLQAIEKKMGRVNRVKSGVKIIEKGPRLIDLDIIFYNNEIINLPNLQIPHPRFSQRNFVLTPINEIAPEFIDPKSQKNIQKLLLELKNPEKVTLWT